MNEPIEEAYRAEMSALAEVLDQLFNGEAKGKERTVGFVLLVFEFGDNKRMNYISNSRRDDMLCAMKEFIAYAEGRTVEQPTGEQ